MRHGKKFNHLGRTAAHRKAMLSNMASSLIEHKRINTTVAKAKSLQKYIEPLITKSKIDTTHNRRTVFSYLQNKISTDLLFGEVASKVATRMGGYTRIIKTGFRLGDGAETAMIELVDFNTTYSSKKEKKTTRRSRRSKSDNSVSETKSAADNQIDAKDEVVSGNEETAEQSPEVDNSTDSQIVDNSEDNEVKKED